ncbi:MAG: hypothetical protein LBQ24_03810 [Candidatus Peribacteria bacterium]|jgi:hypothetical protein|nr:hypothetical protein [Candidatus Peribacteria bacterium]
MLKGIFLSSSISMYGLEDGIFLDTQGTYYNFLSFIRDNIFTVADKEIFFKT